MLGSIIRSARLARGLTLKEVADRCGLSYQFIWDVETDRRNPSLANLERLAGALGLQLLLASGPGGDPNGAGQRDARPATGKTGRGGGRTTADRGAGFHRRDRNGKSSVREVF